MRAWLRSHAAVTFVAYRFEVSLATVGCLFACRRSRFPYLWDWQATLFLWLQFPALLFLYSQFFSFTVADPGLGGAGSFKSVHFCEPVSSESKGTRAMPMAAHSYGELYELSRVFAF